jgi:hypothetical protein
MESVAHVRFGSLADIGPRLSHEPPKADIAERDRHLRFVPQAGVSSELSRKPGGDVAQRRSGPILSRALPEVNGPLQFNKSEFSGVSRHF